MKFADNIIDKLLQYWSVGVGIYERIYPDIPTETTHGCFLIEFRRRSDSEVILKFSAVEDDLEIKSIFYATGTEKEMINELQQFLSKFRNYRQLYSYAIDKCGWRMMESNYRGYQMMKDLLPDGESFEDFNDRFARR